MQKIGAKADSGFTADDLKRASSYLDSLCVPNTLVDLLEDYDDILPKDARGPASVLVVHGGVSEMLGDWASLEDFGAEQHALPADKKALMRGKVVNKVARWNLCFDDTKQEPDYENGKGRVVAFDDVPITSMVRELLPDWFGPKAASLKAEGNYYYDADRCYIGFHGDSERKRVIGVRIGCPLPLFFQWHHKSRPMGDVLEIPLEGGDIYVMSDRAVGHDWRCSSKYTLRHAAGSKKALRIV
jgi:alkylated DNA repair dioxygenase AlkB